MATALVVRDSVAGYSKGDVVTDPAKMADLKLRPARFYHAIELDDEHALVKPASAPGVIALPPPAADAAH